MGVSDNPTPLPVKSKRNRKMNCVPQKIRVLLPTGILLSPGRSRFQLRVPNQMNSNQMNRTAAWNSFPMRTPLVAIDTWLSVIQNRSRFHNLKTQLIALIQGACRPDVRTRSCKLKKTTTTQTARQSGLCDFQKHWLCCRIEGSDNWCWAIPIGDG